jgi:hypothetical protein
MKMLPSLLLASAILTSSLALAGPAERVTEIRGWYETIQKAKPTAERKIEFEAESEPLSGDCTIRAYDGGWQAITLSYAAGDHSGADEHFYFKDDTLFFVYVVSSSWQFAEGSTDDKPKSKDTRTEDRYYYDGATCVRRLTRSATAGDAEKLPALVAKLDQKQTEPGEEAKELHTRAGQLRTAKKAADILKAFDAEGSEVR